MLTCFRRELNRTGVKKAVVFILVFAIMTGCFSTILAPEADAASYKVKKWKNDDGEYCYGLYRGSLPSVLEPTFIQFPGMDVFKSGNLKINFYWPEFTGNEANAEMTEAFGQYLGKNCNTKYTWWYHAVYADYSRYDYAFYPYIISGWRCDKDPLNKLISKSPFTNSEGVKLYLDIIGSGNMTNSRTVHDLGCSWADYYPDQYVTEGFRFEYYGDLIDMYC